MDHLDGAEPVTHGGEGREVWDGAEEQGLARHSGDGSHSLETSQVLDHLVQGIDTLCKAGLAVTVLLPIVQHKLG